MVKSSEIDDLQDRLDALRKAMRTVDELDRKVGQDITVNHPITGEEINTGPVKQKDVEDEKDDVEADELPDVKSLVDSIDFTTAEAPGD